MLESVENTDGGKEKDQEEKLTPGKAYQKKLREYAILMEYKTMIGRVESGVYVIPGFESLHQWYGVLFIHEGEYTGGAFKFCVSLPEMYPTEGEPKVVFDINIFHPLISPKSRQLDLKPANLPTSGGGPAGGYILKLMTYIKEAFYFHEKFWRDLEDDEEGGGVEIDGDKKTEDENAGPEKDDCDKKAVALRKGKELNLCHNPDAAKLYLKDSEAFKLRANESVRESLDRMKIGADPSSSLRFGPYMDSHEVVREKIIRAGAQRANRFKGRSARGRRRGNDYLSWFDPGVRGMNIT
mmetsp:Transcript_15420/g.18542  ORF Transcript_15420/g.18542 Transcript_15420/m.18542 type:complete len:296 (-) Transcript_15420:75-962(-)|eukprot:jgi/Bigna1/88464/estExt_fgenesh1_pg.C_320085